MILATLLLLQAAPAADATTIAARLDTGFRASVKNDARCRVARSTGDPAIDAIGCSALERCVPQFGARYQSANDRATRPEVRKVMRAALDAEVAACIASERKAGIAALVARRGAE